MIRLGQHKLRDKRTVHIVEIEGGGLRAHVSTLGGTLLALWAPDIFGTSADVVLGFDSLEEYLRDTAYLGAAIGRTAGRVAGASVEVDGVDYALDADDGANTLHGGPTGLHNQIWTIDKEGPNYVTLGVQSPDGTGGFPGDLSVLLTMSLIPRGRGGALRLDWLATTTAPTPVALTHHTYWNLNGHDAGTVDAHVLQSDADRLVAIDADCVPTGDLLPVEDTPFDLRTPRRLGELVDADHAQVRAAGGLDHDLLVPPHEDRHSAFRQVASVWAHRRRLDVWTTEPGVHLYDGSKLDALGKGRTPYRQRAGLALETQPPPDATRWPGFPEIVLRPSETLRSRTEYVLS